MNNELFWAAKGLSDLAVENGQPQLNDSGRRCIIAIAEGNVTVESLAVDGFGAGAYLVRRRSFVDPVGEAVFGTRPDTAGVAAAFCR